MFHEIMRQLTGWGQCIASCKGHNCSVLLLEEYLERNVKQKGKVHIQAKQLINPTLISGSSCTKQLGVFLHP